MEAQQVLAIEHDWRLRKLIRANLEPLGFRVQEAVSSQHGLKLLRESTPDLILIDLDSGDTDAGTLVALVSAQLDHPIPIIVMSADPPDRQLMHHRQATSHLQKPFGAPALLRQVRRALDGGAHAHRSA